MIAARILLVNVFQVIVTVLALVTVLFVVLRIIPGDPVLLLLGDYTVTPEQEAQIRTSLGLDLPVHQQYLIYLSQLVRGEFGASFRTGQPVLQEILPVVWPTVALTLSSILLAVAVGLPLGLLAGVKRGTVFDTISTSTAVAFLATPNFWLAIILVYLFSFQLGWFPFFGMGSGAGLLGQVRALVLPSLALGLRFASLVVRIARSALLEEIRQDYVRTAEAKGVTRAHAIRRHVLPNIALQLFTVLGTELSFLIGGAVVIESVFARPGLGKLLLDAVTARDFPVIQVVVVVFVLWVIVVNRIVDMLYPLIDPRLRELT